MSAYDELVNILVKVLDKEDIEDTAEVVSAYTIIQILKDNYLILDDIHNNELIIKNKINDIMASNKIVSYNLLLDNKICKNVFVKFHKDSVSLDLIFSSPDNSDSKVHKVIQKKIDEYPYYCDNKDEKLDDALYDFISPEVTETLEMAEKIHPICVGENRHEMINNEFFNIYFYYGNSGVFTFPIAFKEDFDKNQVQNKQWYGRVSIKELIQNNEEAILRKMPIIVKELPIELQKMYEEHRSHRKNQEIIYQKKL